MPEEAKNAVIHISTQLSTNRAPHPNSKKVTPLHLALGCISYILKELF